MANGMGFGADDAQDGSYGGDFGGGDQQSDWSSIVDAMRGLFGTRQSNMGTIPRHSNAHGFVGGGNVPYGIPRHSNAHGFVGGGNVPQGPYSSPFQSGWGNVDAMTSAYGPGSPVDPMSGGMGNRRGAGWSQGLGQSAFNPNYSGQGSNPMGYGVTAKPGFFGNPSLDFYEGIEYGGGR